jgi:flagellar protein FlbD
MITLKRLNGADIVLNAELIETLEPRGEETVVGLATGNKYVVAETAESISSKVIEYRRKVNSSGKVVNPIRGFERENP